MSVRALPRPVAVEETRLPPSRWLAFSRHFPTVTRHPACWEVACACGDFSAFVTLESLARVRWAEHAADIVPSPEPDE